VEARAGEKQVRAKAEKERGDKAKVDEDKAERLRLQKEVKRLVMHLHETTSRADIAEVRALVLKQERDVLREELKRKRREIDGVLTKVEIAKNRVSLTFGDTKLALNGVVLSSSVKFYLGNEECTINDLKPGMPVALRIELEDGKSVATAVKARKPKKE
jgi:hypothetical protein